jgi:predicted double-glycine peptidase
MKTKLRTIVVFLLLLSCQFCAGVGKTPEQATIIPGVPFFAQETYRCGPAALATVMDYWYKKQGSTEWIMPEQIAADIYSPTAKGVLAMDLEIYARKHGFRTEQYAGNMADLRQNVGRGIPSIIFVDYGFSIYEQHHFMVVTGSTPDAIIVNSGKHENQPVSDKELEKIWKRNRYWTLVIKPSA